MAKQIIIFKRGQLLENDRTKLAENDIIAIECDDPKSVVMPMPGQNIITGDRFIIAALKGLTIGSDFGRKVFVETLRNLVSEVKHDK